MDGKCHQSTVPGQRQVLTTETDLSGILGCESHLACLDTMLKCITFFFFPPEMCFLGMGFRLHRGTERPGEL